MEWITKIGHCKKAEQCFKRWPSSHKNKLYQVVPALSEGSDLVDTIKNGNCELKSLVDSVNFFPKKTSQKAYHTFLTEK